jgi:hypothetical protein
MTQVDLQKLAFGLSRAWGGYLRDWDRSLRSGNHPPTTRYNYLLAAAQLGRYLAEHSPDPDADAAGADPTVVARAHVESDPAHRRLSLSAQPHRSQIQASPRCEERPFLILGTWDWRDC